MWSAWPVLLAAPLLVLALGALLARSGGRQAWKLSRLKPVGWIAARLLARSPSPRWGPALACALECPPGLASRVLLGLVERWGCPPGSVAMALAGRGIMPPLAAAAARGCEPPGEAPRLYAALRALLGAWPPGSTVVYACLHGVRAVRVDGEEYSSLDLPEPLRPALPRAAPAPRPGVFLLRSGCPGLGGIGLEDLAVSVLPEAPPIMPWIAYHVGLELPRGPEPGALLDAVERTARRLAWLALERLGLDAPWEAHAVRDALGLERIECPGEDTLTDSPVLGCPYYSPYRVDPARGERGRAAPLLRSLAARGGNPVRAAVNLSLYGRRELAQEILGAIVPGIAEPGPRPLQFEPWYAGCAPRPRMERARRRCARPPLDCALWRGPGPVEQWAWRLGYRVEAPPCEPLSLDPGSPPRPAARLYSPAGPGLEAALGLARQAGPGALVVVGLEPAAVALAGAAGLGAPWSGESSRGPVVASWERLELEPWVLDAYESVIHLYPERYPKPQWLARLIAEKPWEGLERGLEWVSWLLSDPGTVALTRALPGEGLEHSKERAPGVRAGPLMPGLRAMFRRYWGPTLELRPHQEVALRAVIEGWMPPPGRPVLSVFPTGYGKSAVFQLAGLLLSSLAGGYTLVVSPLRALLRDQVESLRRKGIAAARIDSGVTGRRRRAILELAARGLLDFLYVTPERFQDPVFYGIVANAPPPLAVLDEAHTVVKWGGSFRPSYYYAARSLADIRGESGAPHLALFTASAPGEIARSVLQLVGARDPVEVRLDRDAGLPGEWGSLILRAPTVRENIFFTALPASAGEERVGDLARLIGELAERASRVGEPWIGVVFTGYVRSERHRWANAESLAAELERLTGLGAIAYHGQLGERERRRREDLIYEASRTGRGPRIVVATKAFGMGVDIPNIRWIVHALPSDSIEDYYQEAGRAGRDGLPAIAVHLYREEDYRDRLRMLRQQRPRPSTVLSLYNTLAMLHSRLKRLEGWPLIVLPLDAIPGPERILKAADYLRSAGLLDYWVQRGGVAAYIVERGSPVRPESLPWYMTVGRSTIIGPRLREAPPGWEPVALEVYACASRPGRPLIPVRYRAGGEELGTGGCDEWRRASLPERSTLLMVYLSPEESHGERDYLEPRLFAHVTRIAAREHDALMEYKDIIERAAGMASRKGWDHPEIDRMIKSEVDRRLSTPPPPPPGDPPPGLLGAVRSCPGSSECASAAAEIIALAEEWLGSPRAVALALQDESLIDAVAGAYESLTGRSLEAAYQGVYRRVLQASREGLHRLMDYGFIVVLARSTGRTLRALSRLDGYPYHARLLYHYTV